MFSYSLRALIGALLAITLIAAPASARHRAPDLPPPPAAQGDRITSAFAKLSRSTSWQLVEKVPLRFDAHHPEGVVRLGDRYVLSTVEVIEPTQRYHPPGTIIDGTDRTPGKGIGHLIAFDGEGNLLADRRVDDGANIYHPGGLDYDGRHLWVAVAEYRPNKPSIIFRVDPRSLAATEILRTPDHIGGIAHDTRRDSLVGQQTRLRVGTRPDRARRARGRRGLRARPAGHPDDRRHDDHQHRGRRNQQAPGHRIPPPDRTQPTVLKRGHLLAERTGEPPVSTGKPLERVRRASGDRRARHMRVRGIGPSRETVAESLANMSNTMTTLSSALPPARRRAA